MEIARISLNIVLRSVIEVSKNPVVYYLQHNVWCKIVILSVAKDLRSPFPAVAPCGYALDACAVLLLFALPACLHMELPCFPHQISSPLCEPV